jgi:hypothetical protein
MWMFSGKKSFYPGALAPGMMNLASPLIFVLNFNWTCKRTSPPRSEGTLPPLSVNPRYRIRGTNVRYKNQSNKAENFDLQSGVLCI